MTDSTNPLFGRLDMQDRDSIRLAQPEFSKMADSLQSVGFPGVTDLFATFAGNAHDLAPWLVDAEINHDWNLRLQYLAGFHANLYQSEGIFDEMVKYRKFPDQLFTGSDASKQSVKDAMTKLPAK